MSTSQHYCFLAALGLGQDSLLRGLEQTGKHLILKPGSLSVSPYHFISLVHIYVVLEWNPGLAHAMLRLYH